MDTEEVTGTVAVALDSEDASPFAKSGCVDEDVLVGRPLLFELLLSFIGDRFGRPKKTMAIAVVTL